MSSQWVEDAILQYDTVAAASHSILCITAACHYYGGQAALGHERKVSGKQVPAPFSNYTHAARSGCQALQGRMCSLIPKVVYSRWPGDGINTNTQAQKRDGAASCKCVLATKHNKRISHRHAACSCMQQHTLMKDASQHDSCAAYMKCPCLPCSHEQLSAAADMQRWSYSSANLTHSAARPALASTPLRPDPTSCRCNAKRAAALEPRHGFA